MAVLITADVQGQTPQGYEAMLAKLEGELKKAPGFVLQTAHAIDGGWRVIEVWKSKEDANRFFAKHVAPNLPPGIRPKLSHQELHSIVTAA